MNRTRVQPSLQALLPLTAALWLLYLVTLCLVDHWFYPEPIYGYPHYAINGVIALSSWGIMARCSGRVRRWLGLIPMLIVLMSVVPVVTSHLWTLRRPLLLQASSPEAIILRQMPLLMMALVLTAWQYGWRYVMLYTLSISLLTLALHVGTPVPRVTMVWPPVTITLIQAASFLVVGYYVSALMHCLHKEHMRLSEANARLAFHATTVEELTISRERNRMARELHDTLAHTLSALSVQLEAAKAYWDVDPAASRGILETSLDATRSGLSETRRALRSLRARPIEDLGLLLALRQMTTDAAERGDLDLDLRLPESLPVPSPAVEQCVYRVAQEAVANVLHHANARRLTIELVADGDVVLRVSDDGCGFGPNHIATSGHYGLAGMSERAERVGGRLSIKSQPGEGTTIELTIAPVDTNDTGATR